MPASQDAYSQTAASLHGISSSHILSHCYEECENRRRGLLKCVGTLWSPDQAEGAGIPAPSALGGMRISGTPPPFRGSVYLVNRSVAQGDDKEIPIRSGLDVGCDAKVPAEQQALALGDVKLVIVIRDAVL